VDLAKFLAERLGEDEKAAKTAIEIGEKRYGDHYHDQVGFDAGGIGIDDGWLTVDPARVLREVEAKRKILADLDLSYPDEEHLLRLLAAIYENHEDYDPAWKET